MQVEQDLNHCVRSKANLRRLPEQHRLNPLRGNHAQNLRVQAVPPPHRKRLRKRKYTVRELPSGAELPLGAELTLGAELPSKVKLTSARMCSAAGECAAPNMRETPPCSTTRQSKAGTAGYRDEVPAPVPISTTPPASAGGVVCSPRMGYPKGCTAGAAAGTLRGGRSWGDRCRDFCFRRPHWSR